MLIIGFFKPKSEREINKGYGIDIHPINMTPWKHEKSVSYIIIETTLGIYLLLSVIAG